MCFRIQTVLVRCRFALSSSSFNNCRLPTAAGICSLNFSPDASMCLYVKKNKINKWWITTNSIGKAEEPRADRRERTQTRSALSVFMWPWKQQCNSRARDCHPCVLKFVFYSRSPVNSLFFNSIVGSFRFANPVSFFYATAENHILPVEFAVSRHRRISQSNAMQSFAAFNDNK